MQRVGVEVCVCVSVYNHNPYAEPYTQNRRLVGHSIHRGAGEARRGHGAPGVAGRGLVERAENHGPRRAVVPSSDSSRAGGGKETGASVAA